MAKKPSTSMGAKLAQLGSALLGTPKPTVSKAPPAVKERGHHNDSSQNKNSRAAREKGRVDRPIKSPLAPTSTASSIATAPAISAFVVLEPDEASTLSDLELTLLRAGIPSGRNGVNRASIFRFGLSRLSASDATVSTYLDRSAALRELRTYREPKHERNPVSVELSAAEVAHLIDLEVFLLRKGVAPGTNGVNRSAILRLGLLQLRQTNENNLVAAFREFTDAGRLRRLAERRDRASVND